jgi:hypothetical protein
MPASLNAAGCSPSARIGANSVSLRKMFARALVLASLTLAPALATGVAAQEQPSSPYQARVPVASQAPEEFRRAAAAGLVEVLARISGRADVTGLPAVAQAQGNPDRYVEQFRYEPLPEGGLLLDLRFAPVTVQGLLGSPTSAAAGASDTALLRVDGVASFADYAQLLGYLNRIGARAHPVMVQGEAVTVSVRPAGGMAALAGQLAAERRLLEVPVTVVVEGAADVRSYRWLRGG